MLKDVPTRDPALRLWAIVDEAALHRPVGSTKVMAAQLEHLAACADLPQVTLQALPYAVGSDPGMPAARAFIGHARAQLSRAGMPQRQQSD